MKLNIENRKSIQRKDLPEYIGKEIVIIAHTSSRPEGIDFAWYEVPQVVMLLEYHNLESVIKIEKDRKVYELNLHKIDEIYEG